MGGGAFTVFPDEAHLPVLHHGDLAGLDLPLIDRVHRVQRAGFRGKDDGIPPPAHAQRPKSPWIPGGHQLPRGHHDQGKRSPQALHGPAYRLLHRGAAEALLGNGIGDDLRIRSGLKNGALVLKPGAQLRRIHQVAVVGHGQGPFDIFEGQGLGVFPAPASGGGIAHVSHRHGAVQPLQRLVVKDVAHQP